ncbi:hypothetical protein S245_055718, partial [Arachis hypogaea]
RLKTDYCRATPNLECDHMPILFEKKLSKRNCCINNKITKSQSCHEQGLL